MTDVTHPDVATRNSLADTVVLQLNSGDVILTVGAGGPAAATCPLQNPAFQSPANGVATANLPITDSSAAGNASPVSYADLRTSGGNPIVRGDVGTTGGFDIVISSTQIDAGDTVDITSLTYTAPP